MQKTISVIRHEVVGRLGNGHGSFNYLFVKIDDMLISKIDDNS